MLLISDVHGAFDAMASLRGSHEPLLVLGDFLNIMDYRTGEGITAEILGTEFALEAADARARGDYQGMRALWAQHVSDPEALRSDFHDRAVLQYQQAGMALEGFQSWVTFGNVDRPTLMQEHLPVGATFVDGEIVEIEGLSVGFVGGGTTTPIGAQGEVSDDEMAQKLDRMGPVEILCSHLPPDVPSLRQDVVTGRPERASVPILEYILDTQPRFHFFGDVHQPQASAWRVGRTQCVNVGYFRATRRPIRFDAASFTVGR